jgi:hypothetical protein
MFPAILDVLKVAKGPLTVREVALQLLASKDQANPDHTTIRDLEGGARATSRYKEGKVVQIVSQRMPARWKVIS